MATALPYLQYLLNVRGVATVSHKYTLAKYPINQETCAYSYYVYICV
jgi:hypothetical protein